MKGKQIVGGKFTAYVTSMGEQYFRYMFSFLNSRKIVRLLRKSFTKEKANLVVYEKTSDHISNLTNAIYFIYLFLNDSKTLYCRRGNIGKIFDFGVRHS